MFVTFISVWPLSKFLSIYLVLTSWILHPRILVMFCSKTWVWRNFCEKKMWQCGNFMPLFTWFYVKSISRFLEVHKMPFFPFLEPLNLILVNSSPLKYFIQNSEPLTIRKWQILNICKLQNWFHMVVEKYWNFHTLKGWFHENFF